MKENIPKVERVLNLLAMLLSATDPVPTDLQGGAGGGMKQWCIDRHSRKINIINHGLSVETVPLQALWQKPWHKTTYSVFLTG